MQWNLLPAAGVNAPQAWSNLLADHRAGGRGVVVAVLDTGVAYRNWKGFCRVAGLRPDAVRRARTTSSPTTAIPLDRNGHGTFVAGIIAESTNNRIGLTGLAYGARSCPCACSTPAGEGDETTIARGIRYAVRPRRAGDQPQPRVPAQPGQFGYRDPTDRRALSTTRIATASRSSARPATTSRCRSPIPARAHGVISVGATTKDRCLADYSNGGTGLDLVAPGGGDDAVLPNDPDCHPERSLPAIYQLTLTDPGHWDRFGYPNDYIGTSMASPEVAATAALIIASRVIGPHPTPDQILARMETTATPLPTAGPKPNSDYGYGLINAGPPPRRSGRRRSAGAAEPHDTEHYDTEHHDQRHNDDPTTSTPTTP